MFVEIGRPVGFYNLHIANNLCAYYQALEIRPLQDQMLISRSMGDFMANAQLAENGNFVILRLGLSALGTLGP